MAATVTDQHAILPGDNRAGFIATIQGDASYPTGGYAVTPANFGLTTIYGMASVGSSAGAIGTWNPSAGKVIFINQVTGAQAASLSDQSAAFLPMIVYGI